jgi:2-oxoglutarate ferredoxin oxidoreductase subunit beta
MSEMLAQLDGVCYVERVTVDSPRNIMAAKKAMRKALENQPLKKGFSLVEVISPCPVGWNLNPVDAYRRITEEVLPFYNLGVFKDR